MVISWRPSKLGMEVLTSMIICNTQGSVQCPFPQDSEGSTYLVSHLNELRGCSHRGSWYDAAILFNRAGLDDDDV